MFVQCKITNGKIDIPAAIQCCMDVYLYSTCCVPAQLTCWKIYDNDITV